MKKRIVLLMLALALACFSGCGGKSVPAETKKETKAADAVDVDLTKLSATMIYSQVSNMITDPAKYLGKKVKMDGTMSVYEDPSTGNRYFACVIADATACCSQGIEFELTSRYVYPADYPEPGKYIVVEGIFDTYKEGEGVYYTLRNAELVKL